MTACLFSSMITDVCDGTPLSSMITDVCDGACWDRLKADKVKTRLGVLGTCEASFKEMPAPRLWSLQNAVCSYGTNSSGSADAEEESCHCT